VTGSDEPGCEFSYSRSARSAGSEAAASHTPSAAAIRATVERGDAQTIDPRFVCRRDDHDPQLTLAHWPPFVTSYVSTCKRCGLEVEVFPPKGKAA
jgi:hypothetical protein